MKSQRLRVNKFLTVAAAILFCLFVSASTANAQTAKRKSRRTLQPIVVPTPPSQEEPVVVSRAEDQGRDFPTLVQALPAPQNQDAANGETSGNIDDLTARVKSLEAKNANEYDLKQKRLLLNLDILTRAETRSESLRKQLFDMIDKENAIKVRLEGIENDSRPEMVDRAASFAGSLRPEEIRDARRRNLASDKLNLQSLLTEIQTSRANLVLTLQKSDALVEKLRYKLEKDIDDALTADDSNR